MLLVAAAMVMVILFGSLFGLWTFDKWWGFVEATAPFVPVITAFVYIVGTWALANQGVGRVLRCTDRSRRSSGLLLVLSAVALFVVCLWLPGTDQSHLVDWLRIEQ